jgi:hypothetical protein
MSFFPVIFINLYIIHAIGAKMEVLVNGGATGGGEFLPTMSF